MKKKSIKSGSKTSNKKNKSNGNKPKVEEDTFLESLGKNFLVGVVLGVGVGVGSLTVGAAVAGTTAGIAAISKVLA